MHNIISAAFHGIYMLAVQEHDMPKAHWITEKMQALEELFEIGKYHAISSALDLAVLEKDAGATITAMESILASLDSIYDFTRSPLYAHMMFRPIPNDFISELRNKLIECFRDEETYGFLY